MNENEFLTRHNEMKPFVEKDCSVGKMISP